jgi:hypothetical protein
MANITSEKKNPIVRFFNMNTSGQTSGRNLPLWRQLLLQIVCLAILASVMFPYVHCHNVI